MLTSSLQCDAVPHRLFRQQARQHDDVSPRQQLVPPVEAPLVVEQRLKCVRPFRPFRPLRPFRSLSSVRTIWSDGFPSVRTLCRSVRST